MLRKKGIWLSFVIVLSFALLMGCSSGTQEGSTPANGGTEQNADGTKPVELIVWTFGTTGYEELAKEYSQLNPHVTFKEFTTGTDYGDHHNSLFTAMSAGGGAPDIAMVEVGQYGRFFSAQDHFYNLADFGAVELESRYLEWKWKQATNADGSFIFGLPTDIGPTVMYYRTDVFEQAGLPTDPKEVSANQYVGEI
ncbi:ABC transporter substrate-binding protein [Caldalkalibacillus mannanilyticus]|uniref:ABC transporter substrate-binding protein n=1 Tax=Caldalkalibacillus mannanilyticus TaxID=1418 RepID=UPI000A762D98|nr:extracellular solute-binding protein [Caldalkalibacillus mannanilyticus]